MITASQVAVICLILIAAYVSYLQITKKHAWRWIVAYWVVLTIKNFFDWMRW